MLWLVLWEKIVNLERIVLYSNDKYQDLIDILCKVFPSYIVFPWHLWFMEYPCIN